MITFHATILTLIATVLIRTGVAVTLIVLLSHTTVAK